MCNTQRHLWTRYCKKHFFIPFFFKRIDIKLMYIMISLNMPCALHTALWLVLQQILGSHSWSSLPVCSLTSCLVLFPINLTKYSCNIAWQSCVLWRAFHIMHCNYISLIMQRDQILVIAPRQSMHSRTWLKLKFQSFSHNWF